MCIISGPYKEDKVKKKMRYPELNDRRPSSSHEKGMALVIVILVLAFLQVVGIHAFDNQLVGLIVTDMSQKVRRLYEKELLPEIPMKRPGNPKDVAGVVVFLASDEAKYTTGQVIKVDGGMTL